MSDSPYAPPTAPLRDPPSAPLSWWVAWISASAATGTNYLVGYLASPFLQHLYSPGVSTDTALYQTMFSSVGVNVLVLLIAAGSYFLGGYLAASLALARPVVHALLAGAICIVIGAVGYLGVFSSPLLLWAQVIGFLLTIPCVLAGAAWYSRSRGQEV